MQAAILAYFRRDLLVAFQAMERGRSRRNLMTFCAVRSATQALMRPRKRSGGNLRVQQVNARYHQHDRNGCRPRSTRTPAVRRRVPLFLTTSARFAHSSYSGNLLRRLMTSGLLCAHSSSGTQRRAWTRQKGKQTVSEPLGDGCAHEYAISGGLSTRVPPSKRD